MNLESYPSTKTAWKHVGKRHHHGINIPLFGIHTEKSCGVGEFFDLLPLIDWCNKLGMDVVQLLPLNESGRDPSPYNALSSCALHPIYLSLHALPYLEGMDQEIASLRSFNKTKRMHYLLVYEEKLKFLKTYLNSSKKHLKKEASYEAFVTKHEWLAPYALFRVLKERYNHIHWKHWPENERSPSHSQKRKLYEKYADSMEFYFLVQYLCFSQLQKVKAYATSKNVFLKGDVPILVSPDSADVWHTPSFFDFNHVAGSPPNKFDKEGQYWGFPLYNWKAMHETTTSGGKKDF